jgi:hypothetical protein
MSNDAPTRHPLVESFIAEGKAFFQRVKKEFQEHPFENAFGVGAGGLAAFGIASVFKVCGTAMLATAAGGVLPWLALAAGALTVSAMLNGDKSALRALPTSVGFGLPFGSWPLVWGAAELGSKFGAELDKHLADAKPDAPKPVQPTTAAPSRLSQE